MTDLFIRLLKLSSHEDHFALIEPSKENFLTECLAATLNADKQFMEQFVRQLCGSQLSGCDFENAIVRTQQHYQAPAGSNKRCCVDMVFTLADGTSIGVENKFRSPQGEQQLRRYLHLGFKGLAFITDYDTRLPADIRSHISSNCELCKAQAEREQPTVYLRPRDREHFRWSDFWSILHAASQAATASTLDHALLTFFEHFGFDPPPTTVPDIWGDTDAHKKNGEAFAKYWETTKEGLRQRRWSRIGRAERAGLDVKNGHSRAIKRAWLDPLHSKGSLRLRLVLKEQFSASQWIDLIKPLSFPFREHADLHAVHIPKETLPVVDICVPFKKIFADTVDAKSYPRILAQYVLSIFDAIESAFIAEVERVLREGKIVSLRPMARAKASGPD
jgi:PD-(D/E)XK nuclease superfamily